MADDLVEDIPQADEAPKLQPIPTFDHDPDRWPPFAIVGTDLVTEQGALRISLKFPSRLAAEIDEIPGRRGQLEAIIRGRGEESLLERLGEMDNVERGVLESKWFQAYAQREEASMGEAFSSSAS